MSTYYRCADCRARLVPAKLHRCTALPLRRCTHCGCAHRHGNAHNCWAIRVVIVGEGGDAGAPLDVDVAKADRERDRAPRPVTKVERVRARRFDCADCGREIWFNSIHECESAGQRCATCTTRHANGDMHRCELVQEIVEPAD